MVPTSGGHLCDDEVPTAHFLSSVEMATFLPRVLHPSSSLWYSISATPCSYPQEKVGY